jgi:dihydrolipoamide dehydrogenase
MVMGELTQKTDLLIVGGGPGGYAAAFRAADLGLEVTVVDVEGRLGGTCLFRGCIPSKTLLALALLMDEAGQAAAMGIEFGRPQVHLDAVRAWRDKVVNQLAGGVGTLARQRDVQVVKARAVFEGAQRVRLHGSELTNLDFRHAIVATGSQPIALPGVPFREGGRVMDSTGALALADIPATLLVVGGGYVGLELGSVYAALGSRVTVIEAFDRLLPGTDRELVRPLARRLEERFAAIYLNTKVQTLEERAGEVVVTFEGKVEPAQQSFERVLVAIGRRPSSAGLGLETTGVQLDERGFVQVDEQRRTADEHIYAIGDVVGGAMLAHKAMFEGKVAAEVLAGQPSAFDVRAIPAVVFTDPQVAWCGLTDEEAKKQGKAVQVTRFPWTASGRALTLGATEGLTKFIVEPATGRVLGVGIVGREAGELIAEGVLAVEMGALAEDVAQSMHAHPTLSETEAEAAGAFLGSATHILARKR